MVLYIIKSFLEDDHMKTDKIESLVLTNSEAMFYDDFNGKNHIGRYVCSSDNWIIEGGVLKNINSKNVNDRIDFYADFSKPVSVEIRVKIESFRNTEDDYVFLQLFTPKNYGSNVLGEGIGLFLKRSIEGKGIVEIVQCSNEKIEVISEKHYFDLDVKKWYTLKLETSETQIKAFLNENEINSSYFKNIKFKYTNGGIGLIKGSLGLVFDYIKVFNKKSDTIKIQNLTEGSVVNIINNKNEILMSKQSSTPSLEVKIPNIASGRIELLSEDGDVIAKTLTMDIMRGDVYTFFSIDIDNWITETENKLFSKTLWREKNQIGGIISRLSDPAVFSESTEFAYYYYLHWKYLLEKKEKDLDKIKKIYGLFNKLRESDKEKKHYGLYYERMILEKNKIVGYSTRTIVLGTVGRFLAHYYLLTGDNNVLNELVTLLDQMIEVRLVDPETGELRFYDPIREVNDPLKMSSSYFHGYNPDSKISENKDINIKNSYIVDAYILGFSLTGNDKYFEAAKNITDWLIKQNYDYKSNSFPDTSTHDTMEFLEVVWSVFLLTDDYTYYNIIKNSLKLYNDIRYRGKLIPFRYFCKHDEIYSFDTLTPTQMFLATNLAVWGEKEFLEINKDLLAYLYSIRNNKPNEKLNQNSFWYLERMIMAKIRGLNWNSETLNVNQMWHFRYSAITNSEVRDKWALKGNWMSFTLTYLLHNLLSLKFGAPISIFLGRYYPGQPYVAFSEGKIEEFESDESSVKITFNHSQEFNVKLIIPKWGYSYDLYLEDVELSNLNQENVINVKIKPGRRCLRAIKRN